MKNIVGLTGYATSGKDAAGSILLDLFGGRTLNFSVGVREEVEAAIVSGVWPPGVPLSAADLAGLIFEEVWRKPTSPRMRTLLQWWGTDYRRKQDPDYWVKHLERRLQPRYPYPTYITDVRFPNEVAMIRRRGGEIWRIVRPGVERMNHASERVIDDIQPDRTILNDSTIDALRERAMLTACGGP